MGGMSMVHGDGAAWEELSESLHGSEERVEEIHMPGGEFVTEHIKHMPVEAATGILTDMAASLSDQQRKALSHIVSGTINMEAPETAECH